MAATTLLAERRVESPGMIAARRALGVGVIAGIGLVYLAMVGLVGAFAERPAISGVGVESGAGLLTLGRVMLAGVLLLAGLAITGNLLRRPAHPVPAAPAALAGMLGGAIAGAILGLFLVLAGLIAETGIFLPVSQSLINFLAFDQPVAIGALIWIALGALISGVGAVLQLLDRRDRSAVLNALAVMLIVSLLEPILRPILEQVDLDDLSDFLFERGGLSQAAAAVIFGSVLVLSWAWARPAAPLRTRLAELPAERRRPIGMALAVLALIGLLVLPQVSTGFVSQVLINVGFFLMLALGLNIVVGYAGLLDLGYVAFYAVGAYTMGILTSPTSALGGIASDAVGVEWAFWLGLPVVMIVAALIGIIIGAPVLRLRGDYLAIVTLGFGEIARFLFRSEALRDVVGGPAGVVGIPNMYVPGIGELNSPAEYFYPVVAFAALAAYVAWRLSKSRTGRAWNAMREDETVAAATGVNTTNYKLLAFALGGTLGGISGGLFAVQLRSVYPDSFLLIVSITALAIIILGGMGTIRGVIAGALILVGLPEALREFGEYRYLLYGGALVAMMIMRPEGLFPSRVRRAELHAAEPEDENREQLASSSTGEISTGVSATADKPRAGERVE
jgi:branched-chain amino acid transport system permease protein